MTRRPVRLIWVALAAALGCSREDVPQASPEAGSAAEMTASVSGGLDAMYRGTWTHLVATHPELLQKLLDQAPHRGWILLYERDYPQAAAAFASGTSQEDRYGLGRARMADAEVLDAAYHLALKVQARYLKLWEENFGRVTRTSTYDLLVGMMALKEGRYEDAITALNVYQAGPSPSPATLGPLSQVMEAQALVGAGRSAEALSLLKGTSLNSSPEASAMAEMVRRAAGASTTATTGDMPPLPAGSTVYARRIRILQLVQANQLEPAEALVSAIDFKEADFQERIDLSDGPVDRRYYDPSLLHTLSLLRANQGLKALVEMAYADPFLQASVGTLLQRGEASAAVPIPAVEAASLPMFLFGSFPSGADLPGGFGAPDGRGGMTALFLADARSAPGEPREGRDSRYAVLTGQAYEDQLGRLIAASPSEEGRNTVKGLRLVEGDVRRAIRLHAGSLQREGKLLEALFLLEHTLDKDVSKPGYLNDPLLLLEITSVYVELGRYREALNYLYRLVAVRPEFWLIQETLGNLSVLGTVDQAGRTGQQD